MPYHNATPGTISSSNVQRITVGVFQIRRVINRRLYLIVVHCNPLIVSCARLDQRTDRIVSSFSWTFLCRRLLPSHLFDCALIAGWIA